MKPVTSFCNRSALSKVAQKTLERGCSSSISAPLKNISGLATRNFVSRFYSSHSNGLGKGLILKPISPMQAILTWLEVLRRKPSTDPSAQKLTDIQILDEKDTFISSIYLNEFLKKFIAQNKIAALDWDLASQLIGKIDIEVITNAFLNNYDLFNRGDSAAGYLCLLLLKLFTKHTIPLPVQKECSQDEFKQAMQTSLNMFDVPQFPHRIRFIDFMLADGVCLKYLSPLQHKLFVNLAVRQLQIVDKETWPNKERILLSLLSNETVSRETKINISLNLQDSLCIDTNELAELVVRALLANSIYEAAPYIAYIRQKLPYVKNADIERIFNIPYPSLETLGAIENTNTNEKYYTVQWAFSTPNVIVSEGLVIGFYAHASSAYLLAFYQKSKQLAWGIKVDSINSAITATPQGVLLHQKTNNLFSLVDSKTGLDRFSAIKCDQVYVANDKTIFYRNGNYLFIALSQEVGAEIIYHSSFKNLPLNPFYPLGESIYFKYKEGIQIINYMGEVCFLPQCKEIAYNNGFVYFIQQNQEAKDLTTSISVMLYQNLFTTGPIKKNSLQLDNSNYKILSCEEFSVICEESDGEQRSLVFVQFDEQQSIKHVATHTMNCSLLLDSQRKAVWSLNPNTLKLSKHTKYGSQGVHTIYNRNASLCYVDAETNTSYSISKK